MAQISIQNKSLLRNEEVATSNVSLPLDEQVQNDRLKLLASLRGQKITIPDLRPLFQHWPTKLSEHVDPMREDIQQWINEIVPPGRRRDAFQGADFGLLGSLWYPCADMDKLRIATYVMVWLFIWDDEIDLAGSTMWNDFEAAQLYREQTIAYLRYSLRLDETCRADIDSIIILSFEPIGVALREHYSLEKRKMFFKEMEYFIVMSEREQRQRLDGHIATLDEFWHHRLGSSAVTVCVAMNEYSWGDIDFPADFYADKDVQLLFHYTNTIVSASNDLFSVKKEIKRDAIDSLVPLTYFQTGDIQAAVQQIISFIRGEVSKMDDAAASLQEKYEAQTDEMQKHIRDFIDGCKYYVTGNLIWSVETGRYSVGPMDEKTGAVTMIL